MAKAKPAKNEKYLGFALIASLVTLAILPNAMDAFLIPKAIILILGAIWYFLSDFKIPRKLSKDPLELILISFSIWLFVLLVKSDYKWVTLFGIQGRSIGVLFYLSLIVLMWQARKFPFNKQVYLFNTFLVIGAIALIYGSMQKLQLDPFNWNLVYEGIIGVFGNPNFAGAFAALVGIGGFSLFVEKSRNLNWRIFGAILFLLSIFNIYASNARQGYVSLAIGIAPILVYLLFNLNKLAGLAAVGISIVGLFLFILGLFQTGPLANIVYKQSVSYRGDFWRTAQNMIAENPIFGVGFERFGVNYRSYRDLNQVLRNGVDAYSDNAHNIYLQFAATGGLLLSILYLLLNILVVRNFIQHFRLDSEKRFFYLTIFSIWIAIQAQSLISVDTPSIALWGWLFAGIICAKPTEGIRKRNEITINKVVAIIVLMTMSVLFIFQLNAQSGMRTAFYTQIPKNNEEYAVAKEKLLKQSENREPLNAEWPILSANSLYQDDAFKQSAAAAKRAIHLDSRDYRAWFFLASSQEKLGSFAEAIKSREAAALIDPYNAENLLELGRDYVKINEPAKAKQLINKINEFAPKSSQYSDALKELSR